MDIYDGTTASGEDLIFFRFTKCNHLFTQIASTCLVNGLCVVMVRRMYVHKCVSTLRLYLCVYTST